MMSLIGLTASAGTVSTVNGPVIRAFVKPLNGQL